VAGARFLASRLGPRRSRSNTSDDAGVALVEFALILPVLVLLLFGLLDFGRVLSYWLDQKHLAHETARFAAVNWKAGQPVTLQQYVHDQAETPEMESGGTGSVPTPGLRICIAFPNGGIPAKGDPVKATATLTFRWLEILGLSVTETTLTASSTQRIEADAITNYSAGCHDP
jgi:hypothetical protein